jgi:hypothetical protein
MDSANTVIQNEIFILPPGLKLQAVLGACQFETISVGRFERLGSFPSGERSQEQDNEKEGVQARFGCARIQVHLATSSGHAMWALTTL